jgi:predicted glycoside hydrolase/deacetylase ChbG (UPF0249 family)
MEYHSVRRELPIITADDFGHSSEINQAILTSFRNGWVNSASVMANMPAFEEACSIIDAENLHGQIGVHLNLSAGRPLTEAIAGCPRFCDEDGRFRPVKTSGLRVLLLSPVEQLAVREELDAQVKTCIARGLKPTHLDSHQHQHTAWAIGGIVVDIARDNGVPTIRIMRNCGPAGSLAKRLYRAMFNARLRHFALARSRYFGSIKEARWMLARCQDVEIMVHPHLWRGEVVDSDHLALGQTVEDLLSRGLLSSNAVMASVR